MSHSAGRIVVVMVSAASVAVCPVVERVSAGSVFPDEIHIAVDAAPDVAGTLAARLVVDGVDVTDEFCGPGDPGLGVDLSCRGLPAGGYEVVVAGVPDGLRTSVNCVDEAANRSLAPVVDGRQMEWVCHAVVGLPAVLLTVNGRTRGPVAPAGDVGLVPVPGVTPECIDDIVNGVPAHRCRDLPLGSYEVQVSDVAATAIVRQPWCESLVFGADLETAGGSVATLTDEHWIWWCDVDVEPPAVVSLVSTTGVLPDPSALGLSVTDASGDLTEGCTFAGSNDQPGAWFWSCVLDEGAYSVSFGGIPDGDVIESCETFEIAADPVDPVSCRWSAFFPTPTTTAVPPDALPATGSSRGVTTSAVVSVSLGMVLLAVATKRSRSSR